MEILTIIAAFVMAALSGMGVGSAGLFVVYLTMIAGVAQIEAQGINLVFFLFASLASMGVHLLRRRLPFGHIFLITLTGVAFAALGSQAAMLLPETLTRRLFGAMLTVSGALTLLRREHSDRKDRKKDAKEP